MQFIDPAQLAQVADLQFLARTIVQGLMTGMHRSPHTGAAVEFAQYRPYTQGDDPRFIDWRLYGRTDRLRIKQFQEETNLRCTLLLDCSGSMDYTSHALTKFDYARMLVACLATILQQQHDAAGFIAYHHEILRYVPPGMSANRMRQIFVELDGIRAEGHSDTVGALHYLGDVIRPRGIVVLVSDLLHPLEEMVGHLKSLRARRHDVIVMQISDPAEQTFPFDRTQTFIDAESGREQFAVPETIREQYLENRRNHFDAIRRECLASEIDIVEFTTTEPLEKALYYFLRQRDRTLYTASATGRNVAAGAV